MSAAASPIDGGRAAYTHVRPAPKYPALRDEANVQGNVLAGFNKDHQTFLFLKWSDQEGARGHLATLLPRIATNAQVTVFNEQFSAARRLTGGTDPAALSAVWVGCALTAAGIELVDPDAARTLAHVSDEGVGAFRTGAAGRAALLGDTGPDAPERWLFGRADQVIHLVLTVAADRPQNLLAEVQRQRETAAKHATAIVFEQPGGTLREPRRGREHFGFRDGVSQPGVHGYDAPSTQRPGEVDGRPGTGLVATGEFLLGYDGEGGDAREVPRWMWDGSFLVVRRLAQDVPGWWAHHARVAAASALPADQVAARAVGRWRSGTPVVHDPDMDTRSGRDHVRDNDFDYTRDPDALRAPAQAHIRKTNPRRSPVPGGDETARSRILRRGVPFGLPFDPAAGRGHGVDAERGLLFACYQASIADQFEHIHVAWANNADFPAPETGVDAVIGHRLTQPRFVRTQGCVYAFTPSLSTLRAWAEDDPVP